MEYLNLFVDDDPDALSLHEALHAERNSSTLSMVSVGPRQYDFRAVRLTSGALRGLASSRPEPHVLLAQTSGEVSHERF
jgi:hypothetical protein